MRMVESYCMVRDCSRCEIVAPDMVTALAVRYLLAGLVVILIGGIVTDIIYNIMTSRRAGVK